jgi:hypothetical protein
MEDAPLGDLLVNTANKHKLKIGFLLTSPPGPAQEAGPNPSSETLDAGEDS